jgi:sugar phosphate permease
VYGGFAFDPSIEMIFILFSVYGIFSAATEGVIKAWITNLSGNQNTATAIGFYTSCESICTLLASVIAGALWVNFGSASTFITTSVIAIIVSAYFFLRIKDK